MFDLMCLIMAAEDAHIKQAVTKVCVFTDTQSDCVSRNITYKNKASVVKNFFAVYHYLHVGEIMLPERPPDGPEIRQVADVTRSSFTDAVND